MRQDWERQNLSFINIHENTVPDTSSLTSNFSPAAASEKPRSGGRRRPEDGNYPQSLTALLLTESYDVHLFLLTCSYLCSSPGVFDILTDEAHSLVSWHFHNFTAVCVLSDAAGGSWFDLAVFIAFCCCSMDTDTNAQTWESDSNEAAGRLNLHVFFALWEQIKAFPHLWVSVGPFYSSNRQSCGKVSFTY